MKLVPICNNHLSEFYEAIQSRNIPLMDKLEHELSEEEKCVACTYIYKTDGTVKEALESFLRADGLNIAISHKNTIEDEVIFWGLRVIIFFGIFSIILFISAILNQFLLEKKEFSLFSFNFIEFTLIFLVSIFIFVSIDDNLLE